MTHMRQMAESEGEFTKTDPNLEKCPKCGAMTLECKTWESSCGGYEDCKYTCTAPGCGYVRWVDGIDS